MSIINKELYEQSIRKQIDELIYDYSRIFKDISKYNSDKSFDILRTEIIMGIRKMELFKIENTVDFNDWFNNWELNELLSSDSVENYIIILEQLKKRTKPIKKKKTKTIPKCPDCKVKMQVTAEKSLICPKCSMEQCYMTKMESTSITRHNISQVNYLHFTNWVKRIQGTVINKKLTEDIKKEIKEEFFIKRKNPSLDDLTDIDLINNILIDFGYNKFKQEIFGLYKFIKGKVFQTIDADDEIRLKEYFKKVISWNSKKKIEKEKDYAITYYGFIFKKLLKFLWPGKYDLLADAIPRQQSKTETNNKRAWKEIELILRK